MNCSELQKRTRVHRGTEEIQEHRNGFSFNGDGRLLTEMFRDALPQGSRFKLRKVEKRGGIYALY